MNSHLTLFHKIMHTNIDPTNLIGVIKEQNAVIERLKTLVEDAYKDGYCGGFGDSVYEYQDEVMWNKSLTKKELEK